MCMYLLSELCITVYCLPAFTVQLTSLLGGIDSDQLVYYKHVFKLASICLYTERIWYPL